MKNFFRMFFFSTVLILVAGCLGPDFVYDDTVGSGSYPAAPGYVYTYPAGGCWADGLWYSPCPWTMGPSYGYYSRNGGAYYHRPGVVWGYRPGYPPPWHGGYRGRGSFHEPYRGPDLDSSRHSYRGRH